MILVIDNYDSFVYNLVQYIGEAGYKPVVYRNDKITVKKIMEIKPKAIIISPGPGIPENAGISLKTIKELKGKFPIFGVCLGHQAIAIAFGGKVIKTDKLYHGKTSYIYHDKKTIFKNTKNPFNATRYHSLIVKNEGLPDELEISAYTEDGTIMGLRHKRFKIEGVQFHPESILTFEGKKIVRNFLAEV